MMTMITIPRIRFANLPTPIEVLPRLSAELGGPKILVKRDDLTGIAFGGNKVRKLEFLLAEAQAHGARTIITAGAVQSNHCRQTAAACARLGLRCHLVLSGSRPVAASGNLLLDQLFGAQISFNTRMDGEEALQQAFQQAWEAGQRPYLIPYGGSNPTGATGYVYAMKEMLDQGYRPDWIVFASSSSGTQAGLVAGARIFGYQGKVLGISVDKDEATLKEMVAHLASDTTDLLGEKAEFVPSDISVSADYLGGGYGVMGRAEIDAIRLFARLEGLLLDPVYTGRAAVGLIDLVKKKYFRSDETVLFWHTGGGPALFSEKYAELGEGLSKS
jgi:D-cysteine desulfhydrase family pyridoxal phosphate-dependent enzyme